MSWLYSILNYWYEFIVMILTDIKTHASAFGVAACLGLLFYLLSPSNQEQDKADQNKGSSPAVVQEYLVPSEIVSKLREITTSSLREQASQNYLGLAVEWNLYLKSVLKREEKSIRLLFTDAKDLPHHTSVRCVAFLHNNKILNGIEEGMRLTVTGEISKIIPDNNLIELENVNLKPPAK